MLESSSDQWDETTFLGLVTVPYAAGLDRVRRVRVRGWRPGGLTVTVCIASEAAAGGPAQ
jgi:hypothetical protein